MKDNNEHINNNKESNYENYLENFLNSSNNTATQKPILPTNKPKSDIDTESGIPIAKTPVNIDKPNFTKKELDINLYDDIPLEDLPMGKTYSTGTIIKYRDLKVKDIEFFATLDTTNAFDFKQKLNDILESCIIFKNPDGTYGSYLDLKEGDRAWLLYTIREKSFLNGHKLKINVSVSDKSGKKSKYGIELMRSNIELWDTSNSDEFFSNEEKCFIFNAEFGDTKKTYKILPPTIGLSNCFDQYLKIRYDELKDEYNIDDIKEKINSKFFQLVPYMKPHISYMDYEEMKDLEKWFTEEITESQFFFLDDLITNHLKLGIRGLKKNMDTTEIRTNKIYPDRPRDFFYVPNAFGLFLRQ